MWICNEVESFGNRTIVTISQMLAREKYWGSRKRKLYIIGTTLKLWHFKTTRFSYFDWFLFCSSDLLYVCHLPEFNHFLHICCIESKENELDRGIFCIACELLEKYSPSHRDYVEHFVCQIHWPMKWDSKLTVNKWINCLQFSWTNNHMDRLFVTISDSC